MSAKHADLKPNIPKFCEYFSGWHVDAIENFSESLLEFQEELFEFETWGDNHRRKAEAFITQKQTIWKHKKAFK